MDDKNPAHPTGRRKRPLRRLLAAAVAVAAVAATGLWQLMPAGAQQQEGGFHIDGTQLIDGNGNPFIMRGSTHPDVWYEQEFESFGELSDLGANTVRVVLGSGHRDWGTSTPERVAQIVEECKAQQLICVLEVHDTTGYGEESGAASLDEAVDFWEGMYDVLDGEERYVLVNIGNEPIGNNDAAQWTQATADAVERMRSIGFEHTLVVDAPNWGQDWEQVMLNTAPEVAAADPDGNTLFSVHMYQVYSEPQTVIDYFDTFEQMGLPLIVGEYADAHQGEDVAWETIQTEAHERGIGWIAWSYSGNTDPVIDQFLNFDPAQKTSWGEHAFDSEFGIVNTAERASVYDGDEPPETTTPGEETTTPDDGDGECTAEINVASDWGSGWQGNVTVTAGSSDLSGWEVTWDWPGGQSVTSHWNADLTESGGQVSAGDVGWNGSVSSGQSREVFGFIASGGGASPEVSCEAA